MTTPPTPAPCTGTYRAQQVPGAVIVFADGTHPTSGFDVFLKELPIRVFPPEYGLWHVAPQGMVPQVITPFSVHASFAATERVEAVVVHDVTGRHEVLVEQVPDAACRA
jgi:hypothetical protein